MPPSHSAQPDESDDTAGNSPKRRKIRKGTHSCWACKRRKEKCIFEATASSHADSLCIGCQRRGTKCISQEYPEEATAVQEHAKLMNDRMSKVETLIEHLAQRIGHSSTSPARTSGSEADRSAQDDIHTPVSSQRDRTACGHADNSHQTSHVANGSMRPMMAASRHSTDADLDQPSGPVPIVNRALLRPHTHPGLSDHATIAHQLHEALPTYEDIQALCKASNCQPIGHDDHISVPYSIIGRDGPRTPERLLDVPGPDAHPVLIARHLLNLAILLQQLHPDVHEEIRSLSQPVRPMMERCANTAISLLTTQDRFLGSVESLECVMLESLYQANLGNLRLSWMAGRRALLLAQLMGAHQPRNRPNYEFLDSGSRLDPWHMWFRIVSYDRYLCLMLGFPQGSPDRSMASDERFATDTPLGRFERVHAVIACQILERNGSEMDAAAFALTQDLDKDLQAAARTFPSRWWLMPDMRVAEHLPKTMFWEMRHLWAQLQHFNLQNRLHVPYMLASSTEYNREYSKFACVNASREILSRFIAMRSLNRIAFSCRSIDFLALMAAMTLILAHLDSHRRSSNVNDLLVLQNLSDRATVEKVLENMDELGSLNADPLSIQSADLLRRLLAIEAEAADGSALRAKSVSVQAPQSNETAFALEAKGSDGAVRVHIPYFGVVKIAREGVVSKESSTTVRAAAYYASRNSFPVSVYTASSGVSGLPQSESSMGLSGAASVGINDFYAAGNGAQEQRIGPTSASIPFEEAWANESAVLEPGSGQSGRSRHSVAQRYSGFADPLLPGLTAAADEWTFQGIDMAFFDSLVGTSLEAHDIGTQEPQ